MSWNDSAFSGANALLTFFMKRPSSIHSKVDTPFDWASFGVHSAFLVAMSVSQLPRKRLRTLSSGGLGGGTASLGSLSWARDEEDDRTKTPRATTSAPRNHGPFSMMVS